jgi:hypothetical protein
MDMIGSIIGELCPKNHSERAESVGLQTEGPSLHLALAGSLTRKV